MSKIFKNKSVTKNKTTPVVSEIKNGEWKNGVYTLKNGTMYVEDLDQSRYTIDEIFKRQKTDFRVRKLFFKFQADLARLMEEKNLYWWDRAHSYGVTYFCNRKKAFLFMNMESTHIGVEYYTGNRSIVGIEKSTWSSKNDQKGSKIFWITDLKSLEKALIYVEAAYKIAVE